MSKRTLTILVALVALVFALTVIATSLGSGASSQTHAVPNG